MKLASTDSIWGDGVHSNVPGSSGSVPENVGSLFAFVVTGIIVIAGIILLFYLLWGALQWITSGGEKENLTNARGKIMNALVGMFLVVVVLAVWAYIMGDFGIVTIDGKNVTFNIPRFGD